MNREAIMSALFALLSNAAPFATASRRLNLWSSVPSSEKPALFLVEHNETYKRDTEATPEMVTLEVDAYIYTDAGKDPSVIPAAVLNPLLDAIDAALAPSALTGLQTLGGLASHCWIEGKILKDAGDLEAIHVAIWIAASATPPRNDDSQ